MFRLLCCFQHFFPRNYYPKLVSHWLPIVLLLFLYFVNNFCLVQDCQEQTSCGECFQTSGCGWCASDCLCLAGDRLGPCNCLQRKISLFFLLSLSAHAAFVRPHAWNVVDKQVNKHNLQTNWNSAVWLEGWFFLVFLKF